MSSPSAPAVRPRRFAVLPCPARSGSPDWEWECEECETSESEPDSDDELRTRLYDAGVNAGYNQLRRHEPSRAEILQR